MLDDPTPILYPNVKKWDLIDSISEYNGFLVNRYLTYDGVEGVALNLNCESAGRRTRNTAGGNRFMIVRKNDGEVDCYGNNAAGTDRIVDTSSWNNILSVDAAESTAVGLKIDGTCVSVAAEFITPPDLSSWTEIMKISCGGDYPGGATLGVQVDGTLLSVGYDFGFTDEWNNLTDVSTSYHIAIGLKADGTAILAGPYSFSNSSLWVDLVQVQAGRFCVAGLKSDGTVIFELLDNVWDHGIDPSAWTGVKYIAMKHGKHLLGLKTDGSVVGTGDNTYDQCVLGVTDWYGDFSDFDDAVDIGTSYDTSAVVLLDETVFGAGYDVNGLETQLNNITDGNANTTEPSTSASCYIPSPDEEPDVFNIDNTGYLGVGFWAKVTKKNSFWYFFSDNVYNDMPIIYKGALDYFTDVDFSSHDNHLLGVRPDGSVIYSSTSTPNNVQVLSYIDVKKVAIAARGNGIYLHMLFLHTDGTVSTSGSNNFGELDVTEWEDIVQIDTHYRNSAGLKSDGTVLAIGDNTYGQNNVSSWTDIIEIRLGGLRPASSSSLTPQISWTIGLKSDGTVVAVGDNSLGQCDVNSWTNITQIAVGDTHTLGLKSDGTVVATGHNADGQLDVSGWSDIIQIAAGRHTSYGITSDNFVNHEGDSTYSQDLCENWSNIKEIKAGGDRSVAGLNYNFSFFINDENHYSNFINLFQTYGVDDPFKITSPTFDWRIHIHVESEKWSVRANDSQTYTPSAGNYAVSSNEQDIGSEFVHFYVDFTVVGASLKVRIYENAELVEESTAMTYIIPNDFSNIFLKFPYTSPSIILDEIKFYNEEPTDDLLLTTLQAEIS